MMKFRLIVLGILMLSAICGAVSQGIDNEKAIQSGAVVYYVATTGNDQWSGLGPSRDGADGPFRTVGRAQEAVRELVAVGLNANIEVQIREGTYRLEQTLALTAADSGTVEHSITWRNYPGETVVLSGGKAIAAQWKPHKGNTWMCRLQDGDGNPPRFRDLYVDGVRKLRARWPNVETKVLPWERDEADHHLHPDNPDLLVVKELSDDKKTLGLNRTIPGDLTGQNAEVVHFKYWSTNRVSVIGADGKSITTKDPVGMQGAWYTELIVKDRMFLENADAFIDRPGEWTLRADGTLFYMSEAAQKPDKKEFIVPGLRELVTLYGRSDEPIENVHFSGLHFEHTHWQLPPRGYAPVQATFKGTTDGNIPPHADIPAAIDCRFVTNCSFENIALRHTGANGLKLGLGCKHSHVTNSEFTDIGGNAVMFGDPASAKEKTPQTTHLRLENSLIHEAGQVLFGSVGVWVGYVKDVTISHNEIRDLPYTAISAGWAWSPKPTSQQDCRIRYNYIDNVMRCLTDGAGVYMLGFQPRSDISHNLIRNVLNGNGLYSDQGAKELVFYGNVVDGIGFGNAVENMGHGYFQHLQSKDVKVVNNIFMNTRNELLGRREPEPLGHLAVTLSRNLFISGKAAELSYLDTQEFEREGEHRFEKNCYIRTGDFDLTFGGHSWKTWQAMGYDVDSLYLQADTIFEDPSHSQKNYLLKPDAACLERIGFEQVDVQKAGRLKTP